MAGRILIAGSGARQRALLRMALETEGHQITDGEDVDRTLREACSGVHQVLILSSGFQSVDRYELCRAIRGRSDLGIIVVLEGDTRKGRIAALNAGADDYIASPFVMQELLARVRDVMRRVTRAVREEKCNRIILPDRAIDLQLRRVRGPAGRVSSLTEKEFLVLRCLVSHANAVSTNRELCETVWQRERRGNVEYIRVVIRRLRRKIEPDPGKPRYIVTERSVGYRFLMPSAAGLIK
ncbi:MAG TPA: response regulator transcription factor [Bryobacteraceae bacterium]|jgi:two-component system KDP operon response regulator KdpE